MADLDGLLERLEQLLVEMEELEHPLRDQVLELLDGVDTLHRMALGRLATQLAPEELRRLSGAEPAVAWLFDAYGIHAPEPSPAPRPTPVQLGPIRRGRRAL